jgi:hypothetical protein
MCAIATAGTQASKTPIIASAKSQFGHRERISHYVSAARGIIYGAIGGLLAWTVIIGLVFGW